MASGFTAPGFEPVAAALDDAIELDGETGAAFAAFVDGEAAADVWGGEDRPGRAWSRDTACTIYSATKGLGALCMNMLYDRGLLDADAPVRSYWPEFADGRVLVSHVLSHTAGYEGVPEMVEALSGDHAGLFDQSVLAGALARARPAYEPGSRCVYHGLSIGALESELLRRIDGRTIGTFLSEEVAGPLNLDCWIGMPSGMYHRVADQVQPPLPAGADLEDAPLMSKLPSLLNTARMRSAEMTSGGGICTARGLAGVYVPLAGSGPPLLAPASLKRFVKPVASTPHPGRTALTFGLGWMRMEPEEVALGMSPDTFGHIGAGNNWGFADPVNKVAVGYVKNNLAAGQGHHRLVRAFYECLKQASRSLRR